MSVFAVVGEGELDGTGESEQVRSYIASEISVISVISGHPLNLSNRKWRGVGHWGLNIMIPGSHPRHSSSYPLLS